MVLASDPEWLCGVDVAAPNQLHFAKHLPLIDRMRMMRNCFSDSEVKHLVVNTMKSTNRRLLAAAEATC